MSLVVDASIAAMWFLDEPMSGPAARILEGSTPLAAPDLIRLEVGNVLARAVKAGALAPTDARRALAGLGPPVLDLHASAGLAEDALALALRHGGSVYDGAYLALAVRLDCPLVTHDFELARTAKRAGVAARTLGKTSRTRF